MAAVLRGSTLALGHNREVNALQIAISSGAWQCVGELLPAWGRVSPKVPLGHNKT